ncbi:MAG TPA: DUF58 domain-containing protein [Thermoguttaceae bacterium]|nr:DUF58 domain-containing protein [Thermoguttaceae bacterium]
MNGPCTSRFLDMAALAALEHMRFTTRHHIDGAYSGRHRSRQQGGAGELVDFREYSGSEDLRRLDWKVLARTDKAFVRLYQDETNLLCTLAIDASGSMRFGGNGHPTGSKSLSENGDRHPKSNGGDTLDRQHSGARPRFRIGSKLEYVQFLATALAQVINRGQDQVGLAVLAEGLRELLPPGGTMSHVLHVQERIEQLATVPTVTMAEGLRKVFERSSRRGVLLLMSDFLMEDLEETFAALRLFRHRNWEVVALHVVHPDEERLPAGTAYRFEGLEDEGRVDCSPAEIAAAYERRFSTHLATVRQLALAGGCDYRRVSTAVPYLQTLGSFLVERAG